MYNFLKVFEVDCSYFKLCLENFAVFDTVVLLCR